MECHGDGDRLPGRYISTGVTSGEEEHAVERIIEMRNDVDKDTMSTMVKLATEIDELRDIGQPTAACQVMVFALQEKAGYHEKASSNLRRAEQKTPRSVSTAWYH